MTNKVTFQINIEGQNELKSVTVDARELGEAFSAVKAKVENLEGELVSLSSSFALLEGASDLLSQLRQTLSEFVAEFQEDDLAESRLAQAMRNTMDASDEEIASIKALAEAQEKLGVVSAGVQLSAAQELATYLEYSDSLKTILPVLNDMVAQQLGVGASAESATQIATMLGKVLNGQTEALSRYGYKFDDAQKYILQFGDESERAAVLAEVVEQSVAGMNEALAQTPSGAIAQAKNEIDGMKAAIGKAVSGFMPLISALSDITLSTLGVAKLTKAIKALHLETAIAKVKTIALAAAQQSQAVAARLLSISQFQAANATGVLRAKIIALQATMTLGLALAINLVISLLAKLFNKSEDAAEGIDDVNKAQNAYRQAAAAARAETAADIIALEELIKSKAKEGEKVEELNRKYGDALGTYGSAAEWYDILTSKSKEYCQQLAYEALAVEYKEELAQAIRRQAEAEEMLANTQQYEYKTRWKAKNPFESSNGDGDLYNSERIQLETKEWKAADQAVTDAKAKVDDLTRKMTDAAKRAAELADGLKQVSVVPVTPWTTMNMADLKKAIEEQRGLVESLAGGSDSTAAQKAADELAQMEARYDRLAKKYGLDRMKNSGKTDTDRYNGDKIIENAASYKELGNNIKYYQNKLEEADVKDKESIKIYSQQLAALQEKQAAVKAVTDAAGVPRELKTLGDVNKAIDYQKSLRSRASAEVLAGIDAELARLEDVRDAMERNAKVKPLSLDRAATYQELADALSYYNALLQTANAEERAEIERTIFAYNKKKESLESLAALPEMQDELSNLATLSGKDLRFELETIGLESLESRLRSLKTLMKQPLGSTQTEEIKALILSYTAYRDLLKASAITFADSWNSIKGMGDGVKSLTEAIREDSTAWEKLTSVIDSVISLYQGFKEIIEIIKTITAATKALASAKQTEGIAETTAAAQAAAAGASTIATNAAVQSSEAAKAGMQMTAAATGALSAHAAIPFVGVAIGAGLVASMVALIASLPKFADGGIAYGPTLGLFGEYAGAANNPEVVAPLDRLKTLIGSEGGEVASVRFRIQGRDLVAIMQKEQRIMSRVE